jgi:two-component system LytT family sensor kinase
LTDASVGARAECTQTAYCIAVAIRCKILPVAGSWRKVTTMTAATTRAPTSRWQFLAALWSGCALIDASQTVLVMRAEGRHQPLLPLFTTDLVSWLPWALATPLISRLARRYPIIRGQLAPALAVHFAAFAAVSVTAGAWIAALQVLFNPWYHKQQPTFLNTWGTTLLYQVLTFLIVYALILTVTFSMDARARMARQITETARLNEELSRAQLAALRRQIEPHFMFNTLNSIAGLVRNHSNDAAVGMIVGLSEFLRRATQDSHRAQVTLAEEVEYMQRYLDIQKVRFGERLQVVIEVPAELLGTQVPNLLLQPLVENAIKHGIAKRVSGGTIRVVGAARNGNLLLTVHNDSPSLPADWQSAASGVGIGNLRTRLQILHGSESSLELRRSDVAGVEVEVTLPLREA